MISKFLSNGLCLEKKKGQEGTWRGHIQQTFKGDRDFQFAHINIFFARRLLIETEKIVTEPGSRIQAWLQSQ
jgi:hypothetical protein